MTFYSNPKIKTYGVLNPRGKALYDDSDRFGTKMLEKMGWSKGKGLGANLDGSLDFIKVAHKDNQKGMGFKDRDDQWTQHEDNFNALLKSFEINKNDDRKTNSDSEEEQNASTERTGFGFKNAEPQATKEGVFSGVSLEEQSKNSRKRVHYKKFTRGKDMARYSEQDLANIFGKKSLGDKHALAVDAEPAVEVKEDDDMPEQTFGVTVIKTGLSVSDYFKAKMETMKKNRKGPSGETSSNPFYTYNPDKIELNFRPDDMAEYPELKDIPVHEPQVETKSKKKRKIDESESQIEEEQQIKKSKKSKKSKRSIEEDPDIAVELVLGDEISKKKKKKSKLDHDLMMEEASSDEIPNSILTENVSNVDNQTNENKKKSKKSKKNKHRNDIVDTTLFAEPEELAVELPKKKKKKSREVIPTQPLHFPKFVSNILTSLYDPNITDVGLPELDTDPTLQQPAAPISTTLRDTFEIAKFKAEIFRFFDVDGFAGSTLGDLAGYGYSQNLQLKVVTGYKDDTRIANFWDTALVNKYGSDVIKVQKLAKKNKKYNINILQKKNVFKF